MYKCKSCGAIDTRKFNSDNSVCTECGTPDDFEEFLPENEHFNVYRNMQKYGGGFVYYLGEALMRADIDNIRKIKEAFPEYWEKFKEMK